jgi:hypothetical protein
MSHGSAPSAKAGQLAVLELQPTVANEPQKPEVKQPSPMGARKPADLAAHSAVMRDAGQVVRDLAAPDMPVLIRGATGFGNGVVAEDLRSCRPSQDNRFPWLNCGSIAAQLAESTFFVHESGSLAAPARRPKGLFEAPHGGTTERAQEGPPGSYPCWRDAHSTFAAATGPCRSVGPAFPSPPRSRPWLLGNRNTRRSSQRTGHTVRAGD